MSKPSRKTMLEGRKSGNVARTFGAAACATVFLAGAGPIEGRRGHAAPGARNSAQTGRPLTASSCGDDALGGSPVRRLNQREYANTVRDLFGMNDLVVSGLPVDQTSDAVFDTSGEHQRLAVHDAEPLQEVAARVVAQVVERQGAIARCAPAHASNRRGCTGEILGAFLRRAFRRTPTVKELALYGDLAGRAATLDEGVAVAAQAALSSPHFLFLAVSGSAAGGKVRRLDGFELASRLSYALWSTMPDDTLLALAEKGRLGSPAIHAQQIERMLADPKARSGLLGVFAGRWLDYDRLEDADRNKSARLFPSFTALRSAMRKETDLLFEHVLKADLPADELLTADYSFMSSALASFYGLPAPGSEGDEFVKTALDRTRRRGIVTQASLLASHADDFTDPIARGVFIADRIACRKPPPPPGEVSSLARVSPELPMADRLREHRDDLACASCHRLFDGFGLALENYDAVGSWRTDDKGVPIDPSGVMPADRKPYANAVEMITLLAEGTGFETCFAESFVSYALGRTVEVGSKEFCYVKEIVERHAGSTSSMKRMIIDLLMSDLFTKTGTSAP